MLWDGLRWFEMVWDLMVYCRHVWKSEFVSPVMLFCDVLWKQDGFSMVYFSWCSVMMYDVVLCLCSISCIFILAEEQVLASVPENNVPATAVTFPVYYAFFLECVCYVHHPSLFPYYWIPTTYLYGVGVIVAWCLWLFFFSFLCAVQTSSSFHSYLHQMPNPKKEMLWNVFVLQCFACLATSFYQPCSIMFYLHVQVLL